METTTAVQAFWALFELATTIVFLVGLVVGFRRIRAIEQDVAYLKGRLAGPPAPRGAATAEPAVYDLASTSTPRPR